MKTVEVRSLLVNDIHEKKEVTIPKDIENTFNNWLNRIRKIKCKNSNEKIEPLEIFYAGYVLANPVVRDPIQRSREIRNIKLFP